MDPKRAAWGRLRGVLLGGSNRVIALASILIAAAIFPRPILAQTGVVVEGRVFEDDGNLGIPTATVELEGHGITLTAADGSFRFQGVERGGYRLRVQAFGYTSRTLLLAVEGDTSIRITLEPSPVPLDSLIIDARTIEIEGRVRDPVNDFYLVDADILTDQGQASRTDSHGRFSIEPVLEEVPIQISVRAFGYLPIDSVIVPEEDEEYVFELEPDPVVDAMIEVQVERLEERAAPGFAALFPNLNRDELLRYTGSHTLRSVLEFEYGFWLDRLAVVVVDDERPFTDRDEFNAVLSHVLPEEVQRIEFWQLPGSTRVLLRIYTRGFMREMIALDAELRRITCVQTFETSPLLCP